ncbi:rab11 family-interacting protein 4 [Xenopus tropicalis]|uniref:Rab11 family-interacting protein 4 n=1 Tax=Xenopus tropicalis TaxID=8364 RepID=RFIP4_XENTR|nr:rab11 family-interacting protein 4 [Xenopus tropicalis]A4IIE8.1 RecName: Full=Rab11 family-interacting protein 4; Short=FIP4-Rab11; Short=Rab11-FIP4 [Xenopus tropicalis]AAI35990.1 rab11fip4 protein [Xenopus tropicalis]|eukprot:NP_001096170.1 rab11 family-interacting protein 4 [Xenopus tropicalis]
MERGSCSAPGDPGHLGLFLQRLRQVFDACDGDADGFIKVEHFVALGLQFAQGDEVKKLAKRLDPNAQGRIGFKDFCHGVLAMKGCDKFVKGILGVTGTAPQHYEAPYTPYYYQSPETIEGPFLDTESSYSDSEFFAYEDGLTLSHRDAQHESDLDSAMYSTPSSEASDEGRNEDKAGGLGSLYLPGEQNLLKPSAGSGFSTHSTASLISNEEQFEDYGEGEDIDYSPGSPCPDDESRTNALSDLGSSVPSSAGQTPRKARLMYNTDLLDIYCTQCSKKITLLNDLEARLKNLKANSPNRKISSTAFGRQLLHNSNLSSSNGSTEDLFRDSIDSCENDITEKVSFLEKKVTELENDNLTNGDVKNKLKHENIHLVHRVHELEEFLRDQETKSEQVLDEESKRHRETYSKLAREKGTEIVLLSARVQELQEENEDLLTSLTRLKSHTVRIDEERQRVWDKLEDTSLRLKDETDLYKRLMDKLRQNRLHFQKEREATQELIEDLRRELDHLQIYKLECERSGRGPPSGLTELNVKSREVELEQEIRRLKQDNQKLRDQNDDLNGQILSLSLYEAKSLFSTQTKAQSLAAEIDSASKDELMEALKEQEEINYRLRQYMDKIILAILDHNPSILEIKN